MLARVKGLGCFDVDKTMTAGYLEYLRPFLAARQIAIVFSRVYVVTFATKSKDQCFISVVE